MLQEIDTPGHTAIIAESHPEHVACSQAAPWSDFANGEHNIVSPVISPYDSFPVPEPPAGQLRMASPATTNFTTGLLSSAAKLFPSRLFSTGGDEVNTNCYVKDSETQQILSTTGQTLEGALDTFVQATHATLRDMGKSPVVWEGIEVPICETRNSDWDLEMVLEHNITLSNDTIVMCVEFWCQLSQL